MYSITMLSLYFSFYSSFFLRLSPSSFLSPLCVSLSFSYFLSFHLLLLLLSRLKPSVFSSVLLPRLNTADLFPQNRIRLFFSRSSVSPR